MKVVLDCSMWSGARASAKPGWYRGLEAGGTQWWRAKLGMLQGCLQHWAAGNLWLEHDSCPWPPAALHDCSIAEVFVF